MDFHPVGGVSVGVGVDNGVCSPVGVAVVFAEVVGEIALDIVGVGLVLDEMIFLLPLRFQ